MLGEAIGSILGSAAGVAVSPVPVIAVILMLFSHRAPANALAFSLGWVLALALVGTLVLLADPGGSGGEPSTPGGVLKLVIGAVFLLLAGRQWRTRPTEGEEPSLPGWMETVDGFSPARSFGLALLLAGVNPKNLGLTLSAASSLGAYDLTATAEAVALVVYVLLASVSILGPVVYYYVDGSSAQSALREARSWLTANNHTVMTVLLLVLGAKTLGEGLAIAG